MLRPPVPEDDEQRVQALRRYKIVETEPEQAFDDLARLASVICDTPIALLGFIEEGRQWFKARVGLELTATARDVAFCAHAIAQDDLFVVTDARADERFADNPLVTGPPEIRFYAGAPLVNPDGFALGTLCVIDRKPRALTPTQVAALETLRSAAVAHLELRRRTHDIAALLAQRDALRARLCADCQQAARALLVPPG